MPAPYTFGSAGRNITLAPGYTSLDLSLQHDLALPRETRLQLRFDVFDSLNHTNFNLPGRIASFSSAGAQISPTFGAITSAQDPRELQLGAKYIF